MKKYCIIIQRNNRFEARNEDGKVVCCIRLYEPCQELVKLYGYTIISINSRLGRTILDKVEGHIV